MYPLSPTSFSIENTSRNISYSTRILNAFKITDILCLKSSAIQFLSVFLYFILRFQLLHVTSIHGSCFHRTETLSQKDQSHKSVSQTVAWCAPYYILSRATAFILGYFTFRHYTCVAKICFISKSQQQPATQCHPDLLLQQYFIKNTIT